ncbi:MAG: NmrA family NAD(P)-binding protein, partial [Janthinobacterium lividum]
MGRYDSKWHIEHYLCQSGVPFSIVRPPPFMELLLYSHFGPSQGVVTFFGAPDQIVQFITVRNIGAIAAQLLADSSRYLGLTLDIASDALSGNDVVAKISRRPHGRYRTCRFHPKPPRRTPWPRTLHQDGTASHAIDHTSFTHPQRFDGRIQFHRSLRQIYPGLNDALFGT